MDGDSILAAESDSGGSGILMDDEACIDIMGRDEELDASSSAGIMDSAASHDATDVVNSPADIMMGDSDDDNVVYDTSEAPRPVSSRGGSRVAPSPGGVSNVRWMSGPIDLDSVVDHMLRKLISGDRVNHLTTDMAVRSACLCAGTGCTDWIFCALARGITARLGVGMSHVTVFFCERQPYKQRFVRSHHGRDALIFKDVVDLGSGVAEDCRGHRLRVPLDVDWVFSGPSCKDLSHLNCNRSKFESAISDKTGSFETTFAGTMEYIKKSKAKLATLEMVLGLLTHRRIPSTGNAIRSTCTLQNDAAWGHAFAGAGFEYVFMNAASSGYFLPQARRRVYTIAASPARCRLTHAAVIARLERVR